MFYLGRWRPRSQCLSLCYPGIGSRRKLIPGQERNILWDIPLISQNPTRNSNYTCNVTLKFVFVFVFECNVYNIKQLCKSTRGVLILCYHDQHLVCSVPIEPKMSSGGRRAAEKSTSSRCRMMSVPSLASLRSMVIHYSISRPHGGLRSSSWAL